MVAVRSIGTYGTVAVPLSACRGERPFVFFGAPSARAFGALGQMYASRKTKGKIQVPEGKSFQKVDFKDSANEHVQPGRIARERCARSARSMVLLRRRRLILGADLGIRLLESAGCRFECVKSDFRDFGERYQVASCYGAG